MNGTQHSNHNKNKEGRKDYQGKIEGRKEESVIELTEGMGEGRREK